tara:strand:- start:230 stop:541 length:312 start_codon:yes stop_codon:yes gene_type:complete
MKSEIEEYPLEAMKAGTFVRTNRLNRLGIITDAFYGEKDQDDQPIIIYTILLLPQNNRIKRGLPEDEGYFLTNEYEYEVTGYLMLKPANLKDLNIQLKGGLFL